MTTSKSDQIGLYWLLVCPVAVGGGFGHRKTIRAMARRFCLKTWMKYFVNIWVWGPLGLELSRTHKCDFTIQTMQLKFASSLSYPILIQKSFVGLQIHGNGCFKFNKKSYKTQWISIMTARFLEKCLQVQAHSEDPHANTNRED